MSMSPAPQCPVCLMPIPLCRCDRIRDDRRIREDRQNQQETRRGFVAASIESMLAYLGEDPHRGGLIETPERVIKAWEFMCSGYNTDPASVLKAFEDGSETTDEMVIQANIPLWSNCEHHMLPFFGVAHIGYLPKGRVLGLSKFARLVDVFARRLQVQERLTGQVAEALMKGLEPLGVGVVLQCRHSCMEARGVQKSGSVTTTTALRGVFKDQPHVKAEFLSRVPR